MRNYIECEPRCETTSMTISERGQRTPPVAARKHLTLSTSHTIAAALKDPNHPAISVHEPAEELDEDHGY